MYMYTYICICKHKETLFPCEGDGALAQAAQAAVGSPSLGHSKAGHGLGELARAEVGQGEPQSSLSTL